MKRQTPSQRALKERHLNNATPTSKSAAQEPPASGQGTLSSSNASKAGSMQLQGTVCHKAAKTSPDRKDKLSGDPEWRQRLLGEGAADSASRDLFSPIRLENMFQPPSTRPHSRLPVPERRGGQPFKPPSPRFPAPPRADKLREEAKDAATVSAEEDTPVQINGALPSFRKQAMRDESRKGSVQTRDFLDEAERVMEFIRARGRPTPTEGSQLGRHASEVPGMSDIEEQSGDETLSGRDRDTTVERFSRPPSRENQRALDPEGLNQLDPQVMSRLKAYAENSQLDLITDPSTESSVRARRAEEFSIASLPGRAARGNIYAENPELNIRITDSSTEAEEAELQPGQEHAKPGATGLPDSTGQRSGDGSGSSTARTLQTGSSARSDTKLVIAPQAVSHLISGEIAGMTFDHAKQTWVKRKHVVMDKPKSEGASKVEESTDDPLQNIPDLTVDEIEELQTVRININKQDPKDHVQLSATAVVSVSLQRPDERNGDEEQPIEEPPQAESDEGILELLQHSNSEVGAPIEPVSTLPAEKAQEPAIRSHEVLQSPIEEPVQSQADGVQSKELDEEVEAEILAHESRVPPGLGYGNFKRRPKRDLTITFSSPLVSHSFQIPAHSPSVEAESPSRDNDHPAANGSVLETEVRGFHHTRFAHVDDDQSQSFVIPQRSTFRRTSRISFSARPSASNSFVQPGQRDAFQRMASNDTTIARRPGHAVKVSTPLRQQKARRHVSVADVSALEHFSHVTFHLTPLSDFTVHQPGERLGVEASVLERGGKHAREAGGSRALALTTGDLVRRLTDLEPYEPYWECIRQLDLGRAGLTTLHGLKDFCGRVEKLDASNNRISQLDGAPSTVRFLRVSNNCLSSLTAWGHLVNLQYLDISSNEIDSFVALRGLVHLREIKADNNIISSLEGILHLDGLIKLDISHNDFRDLDFTDATL